MAEQDREALKNAIDDVLDGIDDVLEKNADQFVKSFVQRGGQQPVYKGPQES